MLGTSLFAVALDICLNHCVHHPRLNPDTSATCAWEAARERVQQQVSAKQFQIFELYVAQGWPVSEVKRLPGVSTTQVYLVKPRVGALLKKEARRLGAKF